MSLEQGPIIDTELVYRSAIFLKYNERRSARQAQTAANSNQGKDLR
ncbi:MAG TPA: hypothetical protein VH500_01005 [Nitrososphaeraceae archaeon]